MEKSQLTALGITGETADRLLELAGRELESVKAERDRFKEKLEKADADYKAGLLRRDQEAWLKEQLDSCGVSSVYARRQITEDCVSGRAGLTWANGEFTDFGGFMESAVRRDPALVAAPADETVPAFTGPLGKERTANGRAPSVPAVF